MRARAVRLRPLLAAQGADEAHQALEHLGVAMRLQRAGARAEPGLADLELQAKRRVIVEVRFDPRTLPAYNIAEAAGTSESQRQRSGPGAPVDHTRTPSGSVSLGPVVHLPDDGPLVLSFMNMIEAHVLEAIRRQEKIALLQVRTAVAFLERHSGSRHPLAEHQFETDGVDLFIQKAGLLPEPRGPARDAGGDH